MPTRYLLLLFLLLTTFSQIAPNSTTSFKFANKNIVTDSLGLRALTFLFKAHPELQNATITNITQNNSTLQNSDNANAFMFEMQLDTKKLLAVVTLSTKNGGELVSISPIINTSQGMILGLSVNDTASFQNTTNDSVINSIIIQPVSQNTVQAPPPKNNGKSQNSQGSNSPPPPPPQYQKNTPLGSFVQFGNYTDPRLSLAFQLIEKEHPNIINYQVDQVQYQVTAGINFMIRYEGFDEFTDIVAVVNIDLHLIPTLIEFQIKCEQDRKDCNDHLAQAVFAGEESQLLTHPQLKQYIIISMLVQDISDDSITFMLTFQNVRQQLRALIQMKIVKQKASTLSYYTYSYAL